MFNELEFTKTCEELENPDLVEWEFFTESHDVKIYRQYNENTGLYKYKIYGTMNDVLPETCAQVYMDLKYRKQWDTYAKDLEEIQDGQRKGIYWQVNFPFPMSNRDYTYMRELRQLDINGKQYWCVLARAELFPSHPEKSRVVRVTEYEQSAVLTSDGANGTKAFMRYYDNPGGSIPTWLINWAASSGVPGFLGQMQKACRGYNDFLKL